jgi:hypothetical protein
MDFEIFKKEFDEAFANVSVDELVASFSAMGCEVEPVNPWVSGEITWQESSLCESLLENGTTIICLGDWNRLETSSHFSERPISVPEPIVEGATCGLAADSNELALAA